MPQLTTSLLQKYGDKWTYSLAINDLYFDFMGPSLASAGIAGDGAPINDLGRRRLGKRLSSAFAPSNIRPSPVPNR